MRLTKKILFLVSPFFNYYKLIQAELENNNYDVSVYQMQKNDSVIKEFFSPYRTVDLNEFYNATIENINNQHKIYDYVFILGGELPRFFIEELRNKQKEAYFVKYIWDDIENIPGMMIDVENFDKVYTYSLHDSSNNPSLHYLPFFYVQNLDIPKKYNVSFIASFTQEKYDMIRKVIHNNQEISMYNHLYRKASVYCLKPKYLYALTSFLSMRKLDYTSLIQKFAESQALLEFQAIKQKTPTTRTIEALGTKTKIITTCPEITNYDYYNSNNIYVVDRNNIQINKDWLNTPYQNYDIDLLKKYHISSWVKNILQI